MVDIDPLHTLEQQIVTVEGRLTRRRLREALTSDAGRRWVEEHVSAPIAALRERIRLRDAA